MEHWSRVAEKALRFAYTLSSDVHAVHIEPGNTTVDMHGLTQVWGKFVKNPAEQAGLQPPKLVVLNSPYRFVISPILDYVLQLERQHPERQIAVLVPELVEPRWFYYILHNQRIQCPQGVTTFKGKQANRCDQCAVVSSGGRLKEGWRFCNPAGFRLFVFATTKSSSQSISTQEALVMA